MLLVELTMTTDTKHREIQKPNFAFGVRAIVGDKGFNSSVEKVLVRPGGEVPPTQPRASTCAVAVVGALGDAEPPK